MNNLLFFLTLIPLLAAADTPILPPLVERLKQASMPSFK